MTSTQTTQTQTADPTTAAAPTSLPTPKAPRPIRKKKKRGKKLVVGVALLALGALAFNQFAGAGPAPVLAKLEIVSTEDLPVFSSANGTVVAAQTVPLAFKSAGTIRELNVIIGQNVTSGSVLAALDNSIATREIELRQSGVSEAQAKARGARVGTSPTAKERAAGQAAVQQNEVTTQSNRESERTAAEIAADSNALNNETIAQATDQAATDKLQLAVEEQRLVEATDKRTSAIAKRDAAQLNVDAAKTKTLQMTETRNVVRDELTRLRQRVAELQAVKDEAQRKLQQVTADDDRTRQAAQAAADPSLPFNWAKSSLITSSEANVAAAEKAVAAADAQTIPVQAQLEKANEAVSKAETEQATEQGKLDTAVANLETAQQAVDAANRTREQASITAGRSQKAVDVAKRNAAVVASRDKQSIEAAQQATRQADAATKATRAANGAKGQPARAADIAAADAAVKTAEIALQQAKDRLGDYTIVAPFSGVITSLAVKQGEQATPGTAAITLMTTTGFLVRVGFPEVDAARIEPGDSANITFDALPDKPSKGTVESVEPTATTVNGVSTYFARVLLDSIPSTVRVGMNANVKVLTETKKDALVIPLTAVGQNEDGESTVSKVTKLVEAKGDTPEKRTVETVLVTLGVTADGNVEITDGLKAGDKVEIVEEKK
jgi:HlyD family secretion protein